MLINGISIKLNKFSDFFYTRYTKYINRGYTKYINFSKI